MQLVVQYKLNLPAEIDRWVAQRTKKSLRSKSAEIIFILREKMQAATGDEIGVLAPAAADRTDARQGV